MSRHPRPEQAEPLALQRCGVEAGGVAALRPLADAGDRLRILGRVAGERIERERGIAHAAGDRPDHVARRAGERHHAGIRHQSEGRLEADAILRRGRVLDRAAGLLGERQHAEAGGYRRRRSGAAAARHAVIERDVDGRAGPAVGRVRAGRRENGDVGLAENDAAGGAHARHDRRVRCRDKIDAASAARQKMPATGRRLARHVHRVLHRDRHTGQRAELFAGGAALVDRAGIVERLGVHGNVGVVGRIVALDAREKRRGERLGRNAGGERALAVGQRHLDGEISIARLDIRHEKLL